MVLQYQQRNNRQLRPLNDWGLTRSPDFARTIDLDICNLIISSYLVCQKHFLSFCNTPHKIGDVKSKSYRRPRMVTRDCWFRIRRDPRLRATTPQAGILCLTIQFTIDVMKTVVFIDLISGKGAFSYVSNGVVLPAGSICVPSIVCNP